MCCFLDLMCYSSVDFLCEQDGWTLVEVKGTSAADWISWCVFSQASAANLS